MSAVDTKLMGASGNRFELEQSMALPVCEDFVMCFSELPVLSIHHLSRAVIDVGTQRKAYGSLLSDWHFPFEQSMIDLVDLSMQEEVLQLVVLLLSQRDKHQATCIHVESMNNEGPFYR